ncbi:cytochrome P450 [Aspergillus sclerotioniger CBS 115572]|uniref:Cytochrome P450 n=1 Tax=Aspergillus sclerotioniger CBS 115572 TaxID=1450535 RepID=A0A317WSZ7_9EURO|nr:cytochrome P450 [Aspergillus sclerotioniger CBS 115572]PWY88901.1 cytochrome P450 [Aspergillus sclerotioniger CBS 115572]
MNQNVGPLLTVLGWVVYRLYLDPLSHIPGPFLAKFIPVCNIRMVLTRNLVYTFKELHDTYGPVVRIGPSDLSFATVTAFESIYGFEGDKNFSLYGSRKGLLGSLAGMGDSLSNSTRREQRRLLRPLITTTLSELATASTERYCNIALSEMLQAHSVGQTESTPIPLSTLNDRCLWQLGSMVAFGNRSTEGVRVQFHVNLGWLDHFMCFLEVFCAFLPRAYIQDHIPAFFKTWQTICAIFRQHADPSWMEKQPNHTSFDDNQLVRLRTATSKAGLMDISDGLLQVNSIITGFSVYGATESSLNTLLYFLLQDRHCMKKLEEELLAAFRCIDEVSDSRLAKLPYFNACIDENFRIAPAFNGGILQRVSCGATVDGVYVPAGVGVAVDHYTLAHSKQYWENPDAFYPERWLDSNGKDDFKATRPFLIGVRQCPGRQMAYQVLRVLVAKMVYLYSMELVNKDFDLIRDSSSSYHWGGVKLDVIMTPRTPGVLGY